MPSLEENIRRERLNDWLLLGAYLSVAVSLIAAWLASEAANHACH
jgi:hypothetical protein